jgi:hypothetical protein
MQRDSIETMLSAWMKHQGLVQWITGWAPTENEGGVALLLYGNYAGFHLCKVYHDQFDLLPDYVREAAPASAGPAPQDKSAAQRNGLYRECRPFQIARFQYPGNGERERWRLEGVLRVAKDWQPSAQPAPATPPVAQTAPANGNGAAWEVGRRVLVQGKTVAKPGTVAYDSGGDFLSVRVDGRPLMVSRERVTLA